MGRTSDGTPQHPACRMPNATSGLPACQREQSAAMVSARQTRTTSIGMNKPAAKFRLAAAEKEGPPRGAPLAGSVVDRGERVADQVYRTLRRAIIMGELKPGSRLREVEVAETLKVSRTPVREAISRLIGARLLLELPVGGVEVVDASAELSEIYYIREALESCAARLAAQRITEPLLARLEALIAAAEAIGSKSFDERVRLNQE